MTHQKFTNAYFYDITTMKAFRYFLSHRSIEVHP